MMRPLWLGLALTLASAGALAQSTINPALPANGLPYSAAIIRGQFDSALSDINNITTHLACSPSSTPPGSPTRGTCWLDTSSATWTYKIYDDTTTTFVPIFRIGSATSTTSFIAGNTTDWLSTYAYGFPAPIQAQSPVGGPAVVGASRNTDNTGAAAASIGVIGFNFNFNTSTPASGWGFYGESRHINAARASLTMEADITEFGTAQSITPFTTGSDANVSVAHWIASGGDCTSGHKCFVPGDPSSGPFTGVSAPATAAMVFLNNGSTFNKGIVFKNTALTAAGGGGDGIAIEMADGQSSRWVNGSNATTLEIFSGGNGPQITALNFPLLINNNGAGVLPFAAATSAGIGNNFLAQSEVGIWNLQSTGGGIYFYQRLPGSSPGYRVLGKIIGDGSFFPALYLVSTAPTCDATHKGGTVTITDLLTPTYGATLTGGSTAVRMVYCDGTNWRS